MASHSSTLAWKIPWMEEPGRLRSMGSVSRTQLHDFTFTFHFHALEKEIATHSSVLAWRIPGMAEPSRLPSMGLHRVGHDWSDLAAAAVMLSYFLIFWILKYLVKIKYEISVSQELLINVLLTQNGNLHLPVFIGVMALFLTTHTQNKRQKTHILLN